MRQLSNCANGEALKTGNRLTHITCRGVLRSMEILASPLRKEFGGLKGDQVKLSSWWARRDSNPQPSGYEPPALTIELQAPHIGWIVSFCDAHKAFRANSFALAAFHP